MLRAWRRTARTDAFLWFGLLRVTARTPPYAVIPHTVAGWHNNLGFAGLLQPLTTTVLPPVPY